MIKDEKNIESWRERFDAALEDKDRRGNAEEKATEVTKVKIDVDAENAGVPIFEIYEAEVTREARLKLFEDTFVNMIQISDELNSLGATGLSQSITSSIERRLDSKGKTKEDILSMVDTFGAFVDTLNSRSANKIRSEILGDNKTGLESMQDSVNYVLTETMQWVIEKSEAPYGTKGDLAKIFDSVSRLINQKLTIDEIQNMTQKLAEEAMKYYEPDDYTAFMDTKNRILPVGD